MIEYLMIRENWLFVMYLGVAFMVGVPVIVSWYYHTRVRRLTGGRALRNAQRHLGPIHGSVAGNLANAGEMWRRIQAGEFGPAAHRLVMRCGAVFVLWAVVLAVWLGVLLYAEEQVKARGGWPEAKDEAAAD